MLKVDSIKPDSRLASFIRAFVQRSFRMNGTEAVEPVIARLGVMLEFQFLDPYRIPSYRDETENPCSPVTVIGPITHRRVRIVVRGEVEALAVIFEPIGFYRLFGIPVWRLAEIGTEGQAVLGPAISRVHEELGNSRTFNDRTAILNRFFLSSARRRHIDTDASGYNRSVLATSREFALSSRQLERRLLECIGVAPKTIMRMARFKAALRMRATQTTSWTQIAHATGYYDQMHMIRDFRIFAGDSPGRSFAEIAPGHLINF